MKNERQNINPMFPMPGVMPTNMMMFPNYMNENYTSLDNRLSALEKKVKVMENKISRLENMYQMSNQGGYQNTITTTQTTQSPYQSTQNNNYNDDMYMV